MDEAQIAKQVAQNIKVEEHIPAPVDNTPEEPNPFTSNVEMNVNIYAQQLTDYFELDRISKYTEESQRQLREVFNWAAERSNAKDIETVFNTIRQLEMELGISLKPNRLMRLSKWMELDRKTRALRAQQEMITHG